MNSTIVLNQSDGSKTRIYPYLSSADSIKGSFLILHGMAEHHKRYEQFAHYLNEAGYDVYLYNHRGHGTDKKDEELGYFSSSNGYRKVVSDAITITEYIKKKNRSSHLVLFGHSMGSIILRNVLQQYDKIDGAIICGSTFPPKTLTRLGVVLSYLEKKIKGPNYRSKFLDKLIFQGNQYKKLNKNTSFDWLSKNTHLVDAYIKDPYCGFICTTSFYNDLFHLTLNASKKVRIMRTRNDLPLLIISGDKDPVSAYGKQITKFYLLLKSLGFKNVDCTLYPEGRHELLNETNNMEIMRDIKNWVEKTLSQKC